MFAKFKLNSIRIKNNGYYEFGKTLFDENLSLARRSLDDYVTENNIISAENIEDDWFPQIKADVFISHSHMNERDVIALSGWLKANLGVTSFVDSCVWGYYEDLIRSMEQKWNKNNDMKTSTQIYSHVHMLLNTALYKMIDKTECLLFYNTPKSIAYMDFLGKSTLFSPWIYSELLVGNLIQSKPLADHRSKLVVESAQQFSNMKVEYKICLEDYRNMTAVELNRWKAVVSRKRRNIFCKWTSSDSMDALYDIYNLKNEGYLKVNH